MKLAEGTQPGTQRIADTRGSMSCPGDTNTFVAGLLATDTQGWARLLGLMSQLALPSRPTIEVEVVLGQWVTVDGLTIERDELILISGGNGSRQEYRFARDEQVPNWRHGPRSPMIPSGSR